MPEDWIRNWLFLFDHRACGLKTHDRFRSVGASVRQHRGHFGRSAKQLRLNRIRGFLEWFRYFRFRWRRRRRPNRVVLGRGLTVWSFSGWAVWPDDVRGAQHFFHHPRFRQWRGEFLSYGLVGPDCAGPATWEELVVQFRRVSEFHRFQKIRRR